MTEPVAEPLPVAAPPASPRAGAAPSRGPDVAVRLLQVAGCILLLRQCFARRGLWHDEAKLANAILDLDAAEVLGPLTRHNGTPPLFLLLTDLAETLFGAGEPALRCVPLVAGMACLFLLPAVARRLLSPWGVPAAMAVLVTSSGFLYYANELKPYGPDGAVTLALLLAGGTLFTASPSRRALAAAAAAGALAVWGCYPAIFVLGALGAAATLLAIRARDRAALARAAAVSAVWLASFAALYVVRLRVARGSEYLDHFWRYAHAPFPLASVESAAWYPVAFLGFLRSPVGIELAWLGACALVAGAILLARRGGHAALVLCLPALFAVLASLMHAYPLAGRLLVFAVPLAALLIGEAVGGLRVAGPRVTALLRGGLLAALVAPGAQDALAALREPIRREEVGRMTSVLAARAGPGEELFVYDGAIQMFRYYERRVPLPLLRQTYGFRSREEPERHFAVLDSLPRDRPVWALFGHVHVGVRGSEETLLVAHLRRTRDVLEAYRTAGASLYRLGPSR